MFRTINYLDLYHIFKFLCSLLLLVSQSFLLPWISFFWIISLGRPDSEGLFMVTPFVFLNEDIFILPWCFTYIFLKNSRLPVIWGYYSIFFFYFQLLWLRISLSTFLSFHTHLFSFPLVTFKISFALMNFDLYLIELTLYKVCFTSRI